MSVADKDIQMLALLRNNYREGFKSLYKEHYRMVEHLVVKNSGNGADAEDVFQEIMIVVFDKSRNPQFELSCAMKTFIYSIGRNLWLKKLRDRSRTTSITDFEKYEPVDVEDPGDDTEAASSNVIKALETLGENCRKILSMFYYQKMNMQDIATALGYTNADNAKNQKYKCLQHLKSKLISANA